MSDLTDSEKLLAELSGLIELAEKSTEQLDALVNDYERSRLRNIGYIMAALLAIGASSVSLQLLGANLTDIGLSLAILLIIAATATLSYGFYARLFVAKDLKRILSVESDVNWRLLSLIDEQLNRLRTEQRVSAVVIATLEMRARRLFRHRRY